MLFKEVVVLWPILTKKENACDNNMFILLVCLVCYFSNYTILENNFISQIYFFTRDPTKK